MEFIKYSRRRRYDKLFAAKAFVMLLLFSIGGSKILAQTSKLGTPFITNFSRTVYHAGTQNWAIAQGENGIMYFGNNKGLLEFDGSKWQVHELPNHTIVRSLAIASTGRIYIGGQNELGYFHPDTIGKMEFRSLRHLIPEDNRNFEDIWKTFIREDVIYFCSEKVVFILHDDQMKTVLPPHGRFENFFLSDNRVYFQDRKDGLLVLDGGVLMPIVASQSFVNFRLIDLVVESPQRTIVVTATQGLFTLTPQGVSPWNVQASEALKSSQAYCVTSLSNGNYAIGTTLNGVYIIDKRGFIIQHLNKINGLQNNTVLSVFRDAQQNLWLGLDNGIDYAAINSPLSVIQSASGVQGTGYASIIHQDQVYLGTNQGLYSANWHEEDPDKKTNDFTLVDNSSGQVWSLDKLENTLILGQHKGAFILSENKVSPLSSTQGSWKFMGLRSNPAIALQGTYAGLHVYHSKTNPETNLKEWTFLHAIDGFTESARVFEEDDDGIIWVSHAYQGVFKIKLTPEYKSIESIARYDTTSGLPGNLFINVARVRQEIIFTTPHGIYKYNETTDRFEPHQEFNQLFGKKRNVHRIIEDNLGNIWFSMDDEFGLLKVKEKGVSNLVELSYFSQIKEDLVHGFEHVYAYDHHNIFIGAEKGFIHYNPGHSKNNEFLFNPIIRQVASITHVDSVLFYGADSKGIIAETAFKARMNDFRFTYAVPCYENINHIFYRLKLEGFEDNWSEWSKKTEKEYTNLQHGDYTFLVQAKNPYGLISEKASYKFTISPAWFLTPVAKTAYFLLPLLALFLLIRYMDKREKKNTEALKIEQSKKLERKESAFKREVEKSESEIIKLNNDKLHADIKHKTSQLASTTMHLIQKNEILMKIKSDLHQLAKDIPSDHKKKVKQISRAIEGDLIQDDNWDQFEIYFDQVHENFFKNLRKKFPELTPKDQKLCAYLRMNLSTKEIAPLLNISVRGVEISRYRLRKKLGLNSQTNLVTFIMEA